MPSYSRALAIFTTCQDAIVVATTSQATLTQNAHDVLSFPDLVHDGLVALLQRTLLLFEDLDRAAVHDVDYRLELLDTLVREELDSFAPDPWASPFRDIWQQAAQEREFADSGPGIPG